MELFEYRRAGTLEAALEAAHAGRPEVRGTHNADVQYIAGGTNLTDYMTLGVAKPRVLVDINELRGRFGLIDSDKQRLRLGALARMSEVEDHPVVRRDLLALQQAPSRHGLRRARWHQSPARHPRHQQSLYRDLSR